MKVAITGNVRKLPAETFDDHYRRVYAMIEQAVIDSGFRVTVVCCGRENGVDRSAIQYAQDHGIGYQSFGIRFETTQAAEAMIAFHDGSRTTADVINQMSRDGKLVHIVRTRSKRKSPPAEK